MLTSVLSSELLRLRKRPAVWILLAALLLLLVLVGYLASYGNYRNALNVDGARAGMAPDMETSGEAVDSGPSDAPEDSFEDRAGQSGEGAESPPPHTSFGPDPDALLASIAPAGMVPVVLSMLSAFGTAIALILGVLTMGSEYGWRTVKNLVAQRPDRITLMAGKCGAVVLLCGVFAGVSFMVAAVSALVIAAFEGASMTLPALADLAGGFGTATLMLAAYALFGVFLGVVFKGTGLALGLGLTWFFILENMLIALTPERLSGFLGDTLLSPSVANLSTVFGEMAAGGAFGFQSDIPTTRAFIVVSVYLVAFALVSTGIFQKRSIG